MRLKFSIFLFLIFSVFNTAYGTTYFYWDAENHPCDGSELPNPPFWTQVKSTRGHVVCGSSAQGNRHFEFSTVDGQGDHYTEIHGTQGLPVAVKMGTTYYLAYYKRFDRTGNPLQDIWHTSGDSGDKGVEMLGSGIRWELGRGHWDGAANQPGHYTVWMGNPSYHLNAGLEINDTYHQNQNGYSNSNHIQLAYETWYAVVMAVKMASDNTGSIAAYINGVKVLEYNNIRTAGNNSPTITDIYMGGTIAQNSYDAPAHHRKFDALMLTDNWQDIINGGYLTNVPVPKAPTLY